MNPLSSIYVREPSVLLPQETSDFLCISGTVPVEMDVTHEQESLAVNVEVERRDESLEQHFPSSGLLSVNTGR